MRKIFLTAFVFMVLLAPVWILAGGTENIPIAVSPGSETGVAAISQNCPTFSWSGVAWAQKYRVVVFGVEDERAKIGAEMKLTAKPVLSADIPGGGFSWTPSVSQGLASGADYVWYVGAMDAGGAWAWSSLRRFRVEDASAKLAQSENSQTNLKQKKDRNEANDVTPLRDSTGLSNGKTKNQDGTANAPEGPMGTEGANNTFYGQNAGLSITSGIQNTFIGKNAGYSNTTAYYNTFLGDSAGLSTTAGDFNTFVGNHAGFNNNAGEENVFLGESSGVENTTGIQNVFLGTLCGNKTTIGCGNTFIGYRAGYNHVGGDGNIFIGSHAGSNETGSYKLYIDDNNTSSPLIYGDFYDDKVGINGWLGVGTNSPAYPMELKTTGRNAAIVANRTDGAINFVNATTSYGQFGTVNNFPVRILANAVWRLTLNTDNSLAMASGATCTAGGVWTNASSLALKENITTLNGDEAATALQSLNPVKYNYKADKEEKYVGFIAEEVPELVSMNDRKSLSPMDIVAVLTKVVQEQQKLISALQGKISDLERRMPKEIEKEK
jgi:hypothetical protein